MTVTCPGCGWSTDVSDERIPAEGKKGTCPKCKCAFEVRKEIKTTSQQSPPTEPDTQYSTKTCPFCREQIHPEATNCKHCGSRLGAPPLDVKKKHILQNLENAYLAILRFVVIAVAGVLLVAVAILAFNSFKAIQFAPEPKNISPSVSAQDLIKGIVVAKPTSQATPSQENDSDKPTPDPNVHAHERAAIAIINFVNKYSAYPENMEKAKVMEITEKRSNSLNDPTLASAFAKGFAESIEKTLSDKSVINAAQATSPLNVVNEALNLYTQKFNDQIEIANKEYAVKQQKYSETKAAGIQSLYVAGGAFVAFLAIVFLSIIIRIERNLRHLESRSSIIA